MFELTLRAVSYPLLPSCTNDECDERFNSAHKRPGFGRHSNILIAILPRVRARDESVSYRHLAIYPSGFDVGVN